MHSRLTAWTVAAILAASAASPALARDVNFTYNLDDADGRSISCADIEMRFWIDRTGDDLVTARRSQTVSLRSSSSTPLKVIAAIRGGVSVQPSKDGTMSAEICLAAGADSKDEAERILGQLRVENDNGRLSVDGPESADWGAYIILNVPPATALDMRSENGSLRARGVNGHFTLHSTNGSVSLEGVSGVVDAETQNGAIKFGGHAGDIHLVSQNGPLKVHLDAAKWTGAGLEASTQNGPVSLVVPPALKSGVVVEGSAVSSVKWSGVPLPSTGFDTRSFKLGRGPVRVRLTTQNGPVRVKAAANTPSGTEI